MVEPGRSAGAREAKKKTSSSAGGASTKTKTKPQQQSRKCRDPESPSYRLALRSIFSCRNSTNKQQLGCSSAPSICKVKDNSNRLSKTADNQQATAAGEPCKRRASVSGERCVKKPLREEEAAASNNKLLHGVGSSSSSSSTATTGGAGGSSSSFRGGGMQLRRRLSGCYECHMVVDPISSSSSSMSRICPCPDCGEIFVRQESLQLHQSIRHAVSELGSEDTSRNIIEIIFQSSWLKKQSLCTIQRILKVHNTPRTLARFEDYRQAVKAKASSSASAAGANKHPRCTADGNELLRFHCAALACSLGLHGATHLCDSSSACAACAIIRDGFFTAVDGIRTMATSGRAHDLCDAPDDDDKEEERERAMLVCRVIAGRVKRPQQQQQVEEEEDSEFESVAGSAGLYSTMEELQVFNPTAILPCFVVIYKA